MQRYGDEVKMTYRGVEYSVVQGVEPHLWKWSVAFGRAGQDSTRAAAIASAQRAIDKKLGHSNNQSANVSRSQRG